MVSLILVPFLPISLLPQILLTATSVQPSPLDWMVVAFPRFIKQLCFCEAVTPEAAMGKKKTGGGGGAGLGRALIKERLQTSRGNKRGDSWLHTSELNDGYDWGRLNLQSVTEQSSMDDFLATAELAGTEFVAEKLNIKFVPAEARAGLLSAEEKTRLKKLHEDNKHFLRIPRRPHWDESTSPEALQQAEKDSFLEWRRELAELEEEQKLILTPFERNLEFWRQLWRVIERSDVVVQIVDARNPLLFRCPDLESYVNEVSRIR
ncbi:hypothetical protein INR49_019503 [Caranx melampygus]|nr:hypothetical protein INR49_019503 [Caranx melampygus]